MFMQKTWRCFMRQIKMEMNCMDLEDMEESVDTSMTRMNMKMTMKHGTMHMITSLMDWQSK